MHLTVCFQVIILAVFTQQVGSCCYISIAVSVGDKSVLHNYFSPTSILVYFATIFQYQIGL